MAFRRLMMKNNKTIYPILFIISASHLLNDSLQAVIPAMFPILEKSLSLSFTQLGFIAFTLNMIASVMQPIIGTYTDKKPTPFALPIGLTSSMFGMLALAFAPNFWTILLSVVFIGLGSATFHPEGSRVAYLAAGDRRGLAQSIFQVGGNTGQALAPLITALVLVPLGQFGAIWFTLVAGLAVIFLIYIAKWYQNELIITKQQKKPAPPKKHNQHVSKAIKHALFLLIFLVFARSWYQGTIGNFYAFYAIDTYGISISRAQIFIFTFLISGAVGTFLGGPLADRFGKKAIIFISLIGPAPLAIALPFVNEIIALIMLGSIGILLMLSFSVTVVYAQELVPGKIGTMSGLIVGLSFGLGAIGAVALGVLIDYIGLSLTMILASFLPLIGIFALKLPNDKKVYEWNN